MYEHVCMLTCACVCVCVCVCVYYCILCYAADVLQLCENCPNLMELDLSDAASINLQSVEHIVSHLTSLRYLAMSRCFYVRQFLS